MTFRSNKLKLNFVNSRTIVCIDRDRSISALDRFYHSNRPVDDFVERLESTVRVSSMNTDPKRKRKGFVSSIDLAKRWHVGLDAAKRTIDNRNIVDASKRRVKGIDGYGSTRVLEDVATASEGASIGVGVQLGIGLINRFLAFGFGECSRCSGENRNETRRDKVQVARARQSISLSCWTSQSRCNS